MTETEHHDWLAVRDLGDHLRPGGVWVNVHTGDETVITAFDSRDERVPDPAGGFKDDPQLVVHHTCNAPPGFNKGYGDDLGNFLNHWQPKRDQVRQTQWQWLHKDGCPRQGKVTVDATLCACDAATRATITAAASQSLPSKPPYQNQPAQTPREYAEGDPYP